MLIRTICLYFILLFSVRADDIATTLYPHIYTNLNNWPCVKLLNATGTIGCHSLKKKSGILYQAYTTQDLDNFVHNNILSNDAAVILTLDLLTTSNIEQLIQTKRVAGIIVLIKNELNNTNIPSPDSTCPNCQFGLYANDSDPYQWNPQALNLIEQSFDIPIFAIKPTDDISNNVYNQINQAVTYNAEKQYRQYPLKAVDFDLFMWAAVDAKTCLRRGWCQPVGGMSVYSTPSVNLDADDNKPIIVVSSNLDSRALFHDLTIGASKDISGLVTVLAIAEALSRAPIALDTLPKHILYTLFTAEDWAFAGSQRFVKDITSPFECTNATRAIPCPYLNATCTFPCVRNVDFKRIRFDKIESIFEFQSVSGINSDYMGYYIHVDDQELNQPLVVSLEKYPGLNSASSDGIQRKLPPSSAMSFLQQNRKIKAAVITDYQSKLGNYYNSDLDYQVDLDKVTSSICGLVNSTANAIYNEASNRNSNSSLISANCTLVHSLLDCLVSNFSCPLMQNYFNVSGISTISHYASVLSFQNPQPQLIPRFVLSFLSALNGKATDRACTTIQDCALGEYCIMQKCIKSLTNYHEAYGTGLQYDERKNVVKIVDPSKGTWVESTWDEPQLRIFNITSKIHQAIELVIGLLWAIVSFATVWFVKGYLRKSLKVE
ncbi:hypothetical protein RMCBS344292_05565 [Rhizopus microsporus]|nr:hypothetical protein RMCBS344292_05565 [Rhizopus microsporus]